MFSLGSLGLIAFAIYAGKWVGEILFLNNSPINNNTNELDLIAINQFIEMYKSMNLNQVEYISYLQGENKYFCNEILKARNNLDNATIVYNDLIKQNAILKNQIVYDNMLLNLNIEKLKVLELKDYEFKELIKSQNSVIADLNMRKQELLKEIFNLKKDIIVFNKD